MNDSGIFALVWGTAIAVIAVRHFIVTRRGAKALAGLRTFTEKTGDLNRTKPEEP